MNRTLIGQLLAVAAGVIAQSMLGWWALAVVAFVVGVVYRQMPWISLRFSVGIALAGALMLVWLTWTGHPVGEVRRVLIETTGAPALTLSLLLPALVALCGVYLGAVTGRRVLFG
ncbi:MAG: hypothetical protein SGI84_04260 [Gemmatimonadota bacterium]|nr:hypothetical protein [Gemmatimonadota bacterium]